MMAIGGGGGTLNTATLNVSHPTVNQPNLTFTVTVGGTTVATKSTTTATPYGRVFDETCEFTLGGKSIKWRAYSTDSGQHDDFNNEITVNGTIIIVFETDIMKALDNSYNISYDIQV